MELKQDITYLKAIVSFVNGMIFSVRDVGGDDNKELRRRIDEELKKRKEKGKSEVGVSDAVKIFETKMIRVRPRFMGALASYALLSGLSKKQILDNAGIAMFRMMWFLGSAQDDFIDVVPREDINNSDNPEKLLKQTIFGRYMEFYNACYKVLGDYLEELNIEREAKHKIKVRLKNWYDFLVDQEVGILKMKFEEYNFDNCVKYREEQNFTIGSLLVVLLNGESFEDDKLVKLENIVPKLSFRMQIIDDIGDLEEDLKAKRPSYAVGALMEHKEELQNIIDLTTLSGARKVTPKILKKYAPNSFKLIVDKYNQYGEELKEQGVRGQLLKDIGDKMFVLFPKARDFIYHYINKNWANF